MSINEDAPPLLSLIIPTRERPETLACTLASALAQLSADYEIIVSDNASADSTASIVAASSDPRIRYFNTGIRLSMCDNYEFALERARGKYVLIIGDDDAVIPGALDRLLQLMRVAPEPLIFTWPLHTYDWPTGNRGARVAYLAPAGPPSELDLKAKARFVISMGSWKYYELPSPYHSAIPKQLLDTIRRRTGRVFHSTQPDVFTAMAIPALADRAVKLGFSVTLHGRSTKSNALGFISRSGRSNIERFIGEYGRYAFHPALYPGVSGSANMVPDAVLRARDLFPDFYGETVFNFDAMWAYVCRLRFVSHLEVLKSTGAIRRHHRFHPLRFLFYALVQELSALRRTWLTFWMPLGRFKKNTPEDIFKFASALASNVGESRAQ
jgi:glycosyltransferase involved in cell wall biosynthesis